MKNRTFLVIAALAGFVQGASAQRLLVQVKTAEMWGYADNTGTLAINPQYTRSFPFSKEGLALVTDVKKSTFFIKPDGQAAHLKPEGIDAAEVTNYASRGFSNGLIAFEHKKKWGFMNAKGAVVIDANYDKVTEFDNGVATGQSANGFFIFTSGGDITPVKVESLVDLNNFSEKLASYKTKDRKTGFIDASGNVVIPAQYQSVGDFHGGLAWAKTADGMVGYLDTKGEWAIKAQFKAVKDFDAESGMARVRKDEKWAFANKKGELLFLKESDHFGDFSNGLAWIKLADGKVGFVNTKGEMVIQPQFESVRDFKNGYAAAEQNKLWGFIDKTGKWVIEPKYAAVKDMEVCH